MLFSFVPQEDISAEFETGTPGDFMPISEDGEFSHFATYADGPNIGGIISGSVVVPPVEGWD